MATDVTQAIDRAAEAIIHASEKLGLNNAATSMGAIECLSLEVKGVADGLRAIADAIREST